jgi:ElaB/YqjD/DUF883 family membrane-anchored ribosome-binding protein
MQVSDKRNQTPLHVLSKIIHEEGLPVPPLPYPPNNQGLFEGLSGQIFKGFWAQGFTLMFKERVGAMIIYLYLRLHRFRAGGGDIASLVEQGKQTGATYIQQAGENLSDRVGGVNSSAREMLEGAKGVVLNPGEAAGDVVEKVSEKIVEVVATARDALRGDTGDVKQVVKDAVESAKGEVKGAVEQAKKTGSK